MHSLDRQERSKLRIGFALVALLVLFTTPPALALLRGIGGVPPAPASRDQGAQRRSGDNPPLTSIHGGQP